MYLVYLELRETLELQGQGVLLALQVHKDPPESMVLPVDRVCMETPDCQGPWEVLEQVVFPVLLVLVDLAGQRVLRV